MSYDSSGYPPPPDPNAGRPTPPDPSGQPAPADQPPPYGQPAPYGQPSPYGQPTYGQQPSPYDQPTYGQQPSPYDQPTYGQPPAASYPPPAPPTYGAASYPPPQLGAYGATPSSDPRFGGPTYPQYGAPLYGAAPYGYGEGWVSDKSFVTTWLLAYFLGWLGIDRFYLGKTGSAVAKLLTLGGCGIWALIDVILVLAGVTKDKDGRKLDGYDKNKTMAWIVTGVLFVLGTAARAVTYSSGNGGY